MTTQQQTHTGRRRQSGAQLRQLEEGRGISLIPMAASHILKYKCTVWLEPTTIPLRMAAGYQNCMTQKI